MTRKKYFNFFVKNACKNLSNLLNCLSVTAQICDETGGCRVTKPFFGSGEFPWSMSDFKPGDFFDEFLLLARGSRRCLLVF